MNSYVPMFIFTFLLLFKANNKYAVPVAVLLTTLALAYGILNLYAGLNNLNLIRDFIDWKINWQQVEEDTKGCSPSSTKKGVSPCTC